MAFLDADDLWLPEHLSELAQLIDEFRQVGMISTAHRRVAADAPETAIATIGNQGPVRRRQVDYFVEAARNIGVVWTSSTAVRTSTLRSIGDFPSHRWGQDLALWAKIALGSPVAVSDRTTAIYRTGTGGAMDQMDSESRTQQSSPKSRAEMSPSSAVVVGAMNAGLPDTMPQRSLNIYLNSRLASAVRGSLAMGDGQRAKAISRLRSGPTLPAQNIFLQAVAITPAWFPVTAYRFARQVKRTLATASRRATINQRTSQLDSRQ